MTKQEAMQRFGIKNESDINKDGVTELVKITERQMGVWSLTEFDRKKLSDDHDAYLALLK